MSRKPCTKAIEELSDGDIKYAARLLSEFSGVSAGVAAQALKDGLGDLGKHVARNLCDAMKSVNENPQIPLTIRRVGPTVLVTRGAPTARYA